MRSIQQATVRETSRHLRQMIGAEDTEREYIGWSLGTLA